MKQVIRTMMLLTAALTILSGCDTAQEVMDRIPQPKVMLGAGVMVQIDDNQVAKVFGSDMCETGFGADDVPGCTLLTGNDQVNVTLLMDGRKHQETWTVTRNNDRYTLARPNGYLIREPRTIN